MVCCINFPASMRSLMNRCINKTNNHCDGIDRISDLPSNIIDGILYRLSTQDTIRTSILSRKWRYMWVSVPNLEFRENFFRKCKRHGHEDHEIPNIISGVLLLHDGPINRFVLVIPDQYKFRIKCLSKWIFFLSKKGLQHFALKDVRTDQTYQMPSHFFSCKTMTICDLYNVELSLPPPAFNGFKYLLKLALFYVKLKSSTLETLISGCPILYMLKIGFCDELESINVSSVSLNDLHIEDCKAIKSICLQKARNLTKLSVILSSNSVNNFDKTSVSKFMEFLPKIKELSLGEGYIKILSTGTIPETLHRSIDTLKYLHLNGLDFNDSRQLLFCVCLLKSSPNLLGLFIKSNSIAVVASVLNHFKELNCNNCCLSQLRTVNIIVASAYKHVMELIRFLLANSSSLETLKFMVGVRLSESAQSQLKSIAQDLQKMGRASPKLKVKFIYGHGIIDLEYAGFSICIGSVHCIYF